MYKCINTRLNYLMQTHPKKGAVYGISGSLPVDSSKVI